MDAPSMADVGDALHAVAGMAPAAQIIALLMIGGVLALWIWSRRPQPPGAETFGLVVASMTEQARATSALAEQVERVVEQNAKIIAWFGDAGPNHGR